MTPMKSSDASPLHPAVARFAEIYQDSWYVQQEMIACGLKTVRFPKNTLLSDDVPSANRLAFINAESFGTTFAGDSLSSNRLAVRSLLSKRGLPVPEGRSFRSSSIKTARQYAKLIGYPVVVKPAVHASRRQLVSRAANDKSLASGAKTIASQPLGRRLLIEKHLPGTELHFLVLGTSVATVLRRLSGGVEFEDVTGETDNALQGFAVSALEAIPGLDQGTVELIADSHALAPDDQSVTVLGVDNSPRLAQHESWAGAVGIRPSSKFLRYHAGRAGLNLPEPRSSVEVELTFSGLVDAEAYMAEVIGYLDGFGLTPLGGANAPQADTVSLRVEGLPKDLAAACIVAVEGSEPAYRAHLVTTEPVG